MLEFGGALVELRVEEVAEGLEAGVEDAHLEEVADAEEDLGGVEGLGEKIGGADGEGFAAGFVGGVGGEDEDGWHLLDGDAALEGLDEVEAGEGLHVPVQKQQVGLYVGKLGEGLRGVGDADANGVTGAAENLAENGDIDLLVIDDEDAGVSCYKRGWIELHRDRRMMRAESSRCCVGSIFLAKQWWGAETWRTRKYW